MKTKRLVLCGLFAAIIFIGTYCFHIPINIMGSKSMVHLGTTAIFIAAIFIGKDAAIAGAIGCALADVFIPGCAVWILPTFFIKGLSGYAAGAVAFAKGKEGNSIIQNILGFILGGLVSLFGYFLFNWFVMVGLKTALAKMSTSLITTGIGIAIAVPIAVAIKPIVNKSGVKILKLPR